MGYGRQLLDSLRLRSGQVARRTDAREGGGEIILLRSPSSPPSPLSPLLPTPVRAQGIAPLLPTLPHGDKRSIFQEPFSRV
jgi:hypothetical protein